MPELFDMQDGKKRQDTKTAIDRKRCFKFCFIYLLFANIAIIKLIFVFQPSGVFDFDSIDISLSFFIRSEIDFAPCQFCKFRFDFFC